jgi:hypothetical protein
MSYTVRPVEIPDFNATLDRAQAARQNALAMQMQQREWGQAQAFDNALAQNAPGLVGTGQQQRDALGNLLRSGTQGARFVLPMLQKQQEDAQMREAMANIFGAPQQAPPQMPQAPQPAMPQQPNAPASEDPRQRNAQFAALRQQVLDDPNLLPEQRSAALARISAAAAGASGLPQAPGGYRAAPGVEGAFAGLPAPSGVVPGAGGPQSPVTLPQPGGPRMPTLQQLSAMMTSGNERLMKIAKDMLPLVAQANPNMSFQTIGGQVYAINPQNPAQRIPLGAANTHTETTREIDGVQVRGQVDASGQFTPYPHQTPQGYMPDPTRPGGLQARPGGPAELEAERAAREQKRLEEQRTQEGLTNTSQLRREFNDTQAAKDFAMARPNIDAIRRAVPINTRAADIDMVFAFAKMLDPSSVVREGEQLQLMRTGGVFDTVRGWVDGLNGGGRLEPGVRSAILAQANSRFSVFSDAYNERLGYYRDLAQENGLNPNHVGRPASEPAGPAPTSGRFSAMDFTALQRINPANLTAAEAPQYQARLRALLGQ